MKSLASNQRNDLYLDTDGMLAIAYDLKAIKQNCQHAMQTQLGEMAFALDRGMPTMDVVWHNTNLVQCEAYARQTLRAIAGVLEVTAFTANLKVGVLHYHATIQTIFGTTELTNHG